jgi:hypothetical protein
MPDPVRIPFLERASRVIVLTSALAAASWEIELASRDWLPFLYIGVGAFAVGALLATRLGRRAAGALFSVGYVFPVMCLAAAGFFRNTFFGVWILPLLGAMIATSIDGGWSFPSRWKVPLVFWALVAALAWPVIVFRENDFYLRLFDQTVPLSGSGNTPAFASAWTMNVALTHMAGLLWFDWLARHYGASRKAFVREVVTPLAITALLSAALGVYQGVIDVTWLAGGQWPAINRAGGSLVDGNPSGMLMALWSTLFVTFVMAADWRLKALGLAGVLGAWIAAAASGSRTALFAALVGAVFLLGRTAWLARGRALSWRPVLGVALTAMIVVAAGVFSLRTQSAATRLRPTLPAANASSIATFLRYQLWDRNGPYGTAAVHMVLDSPIVGVGVGSFHTLFPDYSYPINKFYVRSDPDNSQNWFRHQLAEFGLLGSLGWIAWTFIMLRLMWTARPPPSEAVSEAAIKGAILALGLVSLVAMPTQNTVLSMTFWTLAFWWIGIAAPESFEMRALSPAAERANWIGVTAFALVFFAVTVGVSRGRFSIPMRAVKFDWPFTYGFYGIEPDADGGNHRWAQAHAVDVMPAPTRWLKVTVWVNHQDISRKPVDVKVWGDNHLLLNTRLTDMQPIAAVLEIPAGDKRVALQTWASRIVQPHLDYGSPDDRELGLLVRCEFLPAPPAR